MFWTNVEASFHRVDLHLGLSGPISYEYSCLTHDFRNISPLIYCLAGNIVVLYSPPPIFPSPRGTYCESPLLDLPMVRGCSILNLILLTRIQLTHVQLTQVSVSPLSTFLEASRKRENIPEIVH